MATYTRPTPLSEVVGGLKDRTSGLCAAITRSLESANPDQKQLLESLVGELQKFEEAIGDLQALARDLEAEDDTHLRWDGVIPLLEGCRSMLDTFNGEFETLPSSAISDMRIITENYREGFSRTVNISESLHEVHSLLYEISQYLPEPTAQNLTDKPPDERETTAWLEVPPKPKVLTATRETVSSWLRLLNSEEHNREPEELYFERRRVEERRSKCPEYSTAAGKWPEYCEMYWETLKPDVLLLFKTPQSFQFVQWALEYLNVTHPGRFDSLDTAAAGGLLDLTDALCDGSISPLHFASALGLPSLMKALLSSGTVDVQKNGRLGTPLYCALMGPHVFVSGSRPHCWSTFLPNRLEMQQNTEAISLLLDKGASCKYQFYWQSGESASLAGLALWVATMNKDASIFSKVVNQGGAVLDQPFAELLDSSMMIGPTHTAGVTYNQVLTLCYDTLLALPSMTELDLKTFRRIEEILDDEMRGLDILPGSQRLPHISDSEFDALVRVAIVDGDLWQFRRLSYDPRFNRETPANLVADEGTIAHLAVSGDDTDIASIAFQAGCDFTATDGEGRTPLMVAESRRMLSLLVDELGLNTTDTDNLGRNIWHLAAATNDVDCLSWLHESDPSKDENMVAKTHEGRTPLTEALLFIYTLIGGTNETRPTSYSSECVELLLRCEAPLSWPFPTRPLSHCIAAWGKLNILEVLVKSGVSFREIDAQGRTALHHLNISATVEFVARVLELCEDLPLTTDEDLTPAETMILNTLYRSKSGGYCPLKYLMDRCVMPLHNFDRLLVPRVVQYHDYLGRGCWARFCQVVLPKLVFDEKTDDPMANHLQETTRQLSLIVVQRLINRQALSFYESETFNPAVSCLWSQGVHQIATAVDFPFIRYILEKSDEDIMNGFYGSKDGLVLFKHALVRRNYDVLEFLAWRGTPLHLPLRNMGYPTFIEAAIMLDSHDIERLVTLLPIIGPEKLRSRQREIFRLIMNPEYDNRDIKLVRLLERGLNPDFIFDPGLDSPRPTTLLTEVMQRSQRHLATVIFECGGDPTLGPKGYGALMWAIENKKHESLDAMVLRASTMCGNNRLYEDEDGVTYNALQLAAHVGNDHALMMLLENTKLADHINGGTESNASPPLHLAAASNSQPCLEVLMDMCADMRVLDGNGDTALHVAAKAGHATAIQFLIAYDLCDVPDKQGKIPLDYAVENEDEEAMRILKSPRPETPCKDDGAEESKVADDTT